MELTEFLELVVEKNASDGFAAVGSAPILKVNGDLWAAGCGLRAADSEDHILLAIKLDSPLGREDGRQAFDVEAPTGAHLDKWWKDQ